MKAGQITAKLRDAVPVCFYINGSEATRYKNIDIPDSLKGLDITDFGFNVPADGKITFRLHFAEGILPAVFPPAREKLTRAKKAAFKAAKVEAAAETTESEVETTEPETETAIEENVESEPEAPAEPEITETRFNVTGDRRKALAKAVENYTCDGMVYRGAPSYAYRVGDYIIDRKGTLIGGTTPEMLAVLEAQGFTAAAE